MKKHLLIALVLGLSTTICHSQVKISVQGGTGLTGITKNENYNANFGYRFGVGVEFPIDKTWSMQTGALKEGAEMLYVAMFDEIDEGTAIFKCAKKVPVGASTFVPIEEGIGSDHYLWLVGQAGKMLRKEIPLEMKQPVR